MEKKKETQFRKLATCLTRDQGANLSHDSRGAISQENEGVSGLEIYFLWRQQRNEWRLRHSKLKIWSLVSSRVQNTCWIQ